MPTLGPDEYPLWLFKPPNPFIQILAYNCGGAPLVYLQYCVDAARASDATLFRMCKNATLFPGVGYNQGVPPPWNTLGFYQYEAAMRSQDNLISLEELARDQAQLRMRLFPQLN
jgi:hypothetical protein